MRPRQERLAESCRIGAAGALPGRLRTQPPGNLPRELNTEFLQDILGGDGAIGAVLNEVQPCWSALHWLAPRLTHELFTDAQPPAADDLLRFQLRWPDHFPGAR